MYNLLLENDMDLLEAIELEGYFSREDLEHKFYSGDREDKRPIDKTDPRNIITLATRKLNEEIRKREFIVLLGKIRKGYEDDDEYINFIRGKSKSLKLWEYNLQTSREDLDITDLNSRLKLLDNVLHSINNTISGYNYYFELKKEDYIEGYIIIHKR